MATYINNNVKFHGFSKSPVSPDTTLGGAVNPSGHTITTSQVRAQDIPAFLNTFAGSRADAITWVEKNYTTPAHNDIVFYGGEFKAGFDTPKCLKYNGKTSTWEDFDLKYSDRANNVLRTTLKNADDKDVIAIHQDCSTVFVDGGNNAATNSNRWSLFVKKKSDGSILDHFVASTDKIVAGMPSLGYNALVMWNKAAIDEGELDANYVGNTFAGIVHLNKQYNTGDDAKFTVTCFEYIGDKLDTTLVDIDEKISKVVGDAFEGAVASVTADTNTKNLGLTVSEGANPVITVTPGTIAESKLVTGSTVKTYVDTTALAEGGSIAQAIADYVATNAKVSVNEVEAKKVTVASGSQTGDLVQIVVTNDKTKAEDGEIGIKLSAQIEAAQWDEATQSFKNPDAVLVAGVAQTVINNTIINQITEVVGDVGEGETPTIATAIKKGITDATLADGQKIATTTDTSKLVTVEDVTTYVSENAKVTLTQGTGITVTPNGEASTSFTVAVDETVATKDSVDDLDTRLDTAEGTLKTLTEAGGVIESIQSDIEAIETSLTTGAIHTEIDGVRQTANAAKATADTAVQTVSKSGSSTLLSVTQTGTSVTVGLSDTVATKSDITTEINKLSAADGAITALSGRVSDIETSLAAGGETAEAIAAAKKAGTDAQTAADAKVANITVDGTSIVTGAAGSKTATLTTTKGVEITPSATSTSTALATEASVAKAIASITSVGVSYEVIPDGQTHTSITAPVKGRIYLEKDTTNAEAGVYIEWMYTEKGWEQIGSTKTDHSSYASKITVNGSEKSVANSAIDLGAFASSVTAGNGVASGSVSATGALSLVLTTASTATAGITKLTNTYTATEEDKAATGKSIAAAIATLDSSKSVNGITVNQENGVITSVTEELITATVPANTTKVEGNVAYVGSTKHVIAPEKFQTAAQMPSTLTSWVADLSNLTTGDNMFKGCTGLTVFVGDLSSLTSGIDMFNGCTLDDESLEILAENLPTVTSGTIDFGASTNATADVIATIKGKGWTLKSNGAAL